MAGMTELRAVLASLAGLAGVALFVATPAWASQSEAPAGPSSTVSGVTVTAPEKPDPLVDKATRFVQQRLSTSRFEQYARFRDPVCVKVVGLPDKFDDFIAQRIVEVARRVNAPVDPRRGCAPNVNVIFSAQPQAQLADISRRRDILFGFHFQAEMKRLSTFSRPIQAWYVTRTEDTDGARVLELNDPHPYDSDSGKAPGAKGRAGSRLGADMSSELVHSLIIADANKVAGERIEAVADYIAVLTLSRWRDLERCSGMPTILNLMADGCDAGDRPEAATPGDLALLSGLYAVNPRETGALQRASIASAVRRASETEPPSRR
jgi:hypothetical protein